MTYRGKLGGRAIETAISKALDMAWEEYKLQEKHCIERQSKTGAFLGRKALEKIKKLAHKRKIELLELYTEDKRRLNAYNNNIHSISIISKQNTKEETNNG
jgi:hypothetical protein